MTGYPGGPALPAASLSSLHSLKSSIQPLTSSAPPGKDQQKPSLLHQRWDGQDPGAWGSISFRLREISLPAGTTQSLGVGRARGDLSRERYSVSFPNGDQGQTHRKGCGGVCFQSPKEIYPNFLQR